jgi:hypothetical protein
MSYTPAIRNFNAAAPPHRTKPLRHARVRCGAFSYSLSHFKRFLATGLSSTMTVEEIGVNPLLIAALAVVLVVLYISLSGTQHDHREPPLIPAKLPFFGHALNLMKDGLPYYRKLA